MAWKTLGKALLYPGRWVMALLTPIAIACLVTVALTLPAEHPLSIGAYVLSAYTLTVWCFRIPAVIHTIKTFKAENPLARRWLEDERLRVNVSLYSALAGNGLYAILQLGLGITHGSFWFYSLAGYYVCLAIMRYFLLRYTTRHKAGEHLISELLRYRACGYIFLFMNLALSLMIFFMVYFDRTFHHHEITTIALAAYTFTAMTVAIINIVKYRKYQSPAYAASKAIGLAAACVSVLTLEATMLTTFGEAEGIPFRRLMLGLTGGAISFVIITMAIGMIVQSTKKLRLIKTETVTHGE